MLLNVAAAAVWTEERKLEAQIPCETLGMCPRCKEHLETMHHRVWACRCNVDHQAFTASDHLKSRAAREMTSTPCLWLRGLIPQTWLEPLPPNPDRYFSSVGAYGQTQGFARVSPDDPYVLLFGDASGGEHASHPQLRRIGCGLAQLTSLANPDFHAGLFWNLCDEDSNIVARGELMAFLVALRSVSREDKLVYVPDDDKVYDGWRNKLWKHIPQDGLLDARAPANLDLWQLVGVELARRRAPTLVIVVESHVSEQDLAAGFTSHLMELGNDLADALARRGADSVQVPEACAQTWLRAEGTARLVQDRIVQASIAVLEAVGPPPRRQPASRAPRITLVSRLQGLGHCLFRRGKHRLHCTRCHQGCKHPSGSPLALRGWVADGTCVPQPAGPLVPGRRVWFGEAPLHPTHALCWSQLDSAWVCQVCGAQASLRARRLGARCVGRPSSSGRALLSRLVKGLPLRASRGPLLHGTRLVPAPQRRSDASSPDSTAPVAPPSAWTAFKQRVLARVREPKNGID